MEIRTFRDTLGLSERFKSKIDKGLPEHKYTLLMETQTFTAGCGTMVKGTNYYIATENNIYKIRNSCDKSVLENYTYEEADNDIYRNCSVCALFRDIPGETMHLQIPGK